MHIQQASDFLSKDPSKEHLSYFTKQLVQFKYEPTTPLSDLLEFINENTIQWLQQLPKTAKSKNTLSKYRTSITTLLNKEQVRENLGTQYCSVLEKKINDTFKNNVDNIVDERNGTNVSTNDDVETSYSDDSDTDSFPDVKTLEVKLDSENNTDEYKKHIESLNKKYNEIRIKYDNLQELYNKLYDDYRSLDAKYSTKENDFLREIVRNLTTK